MRQKLSSWPVLCLVITGGFLTGDIPSAHATGSDLVSIQTPSGITIKAEIADTPLKRSMGLMYRDQLKKDHGMLFFFSQPMAWTFWMKNTKIPLDIIWMDAKKTIIHIERNVPICTRQDDGCPQYHSDEGALYVLELGAGRAAALQLQRGVKLSFKQP